MINELAEAVARKAPLRVDQVEHSDPTTTLIGQSWSIAITCPWRLLHHESLVVDWQDDAAADAVWELVGNAITSIAPRSPQHPRDPVLKLSDGYALEIEADSDLDPWVFRVAGHTYVGSKSG